MANVCFVGLGVMGYHMAGHLQKRGGHTVTVFNRTATKADKWAQEFGGKVASTPAAAAKGADFIFSCVGNDDDVRAITAGPDGTFAGMKPGAIHIDNTTASAKVARELHKIAAERGFGFLDAPVSGGEAGAVNGALTVMVGGDDAHFIAAQPVIANFSRMVGHMGASGSGQLAKMVNQICIAGLVQGLSEGLYFAEKTGLDIAKVIEAISKGAAQSWQMENRWETMRDNKFAFGFAVEWMRKDLGICLDSAKDAGARLPVTALVDQFYGDVQQMGGERWDTSSLIARLRKFDESK